MKREKIGSDMELAKLMVITMALFMIFMGLQDMMLNRLAELNCIDTILLSIVEGSLSFMLRVIIITRAWKLSRDKFIDGIDDNDGELKLRSS